MVARFRTPLFNLRNCYKIRMKCFNVSHPFTEDSDSMYRISLRLTDIRNIELLSSVNRSLMITLSIYYGPVGRVGQNCVDDR